MLMRSLGYASLAGRGRYPSPFTDVTSTRLHHPGLRPGDHRRRGRRGLRPRQERHPVRCGGALPQTRLLFPAFPALLYALFAAILCVMYWLRTFTGLLSSHPHA